MEGLYSSPSKEFARFCFCLHGVLISDTRDGYEGKYAAALKDKDVWVMNVVPENGPNTLKIECDRDLIGTVHKWYAHEFIAKVQLPLKQ